MLKKCDQSIQSIHSEKFSFEHYLTGFRYIWYLLKYIEILFSAE